MVHGTCLCRDVQWEVDGDFQLMSHCHCSICRKSHGTGYGTYVAASEQGFRWTQGEDRIRRYESTPGFFRPFCGRCGSKLPGEPHDGLRFMPAGNLDDDPGTRPVAHIFVGSRAPWDTIADDVRQFDAAPPGFPAPDLSETSVPPASRAGAVRGSCLCGKVVYEISGTFDAIVKCHCSRCRKGRSAAHCNNLFVSDPEFSWESGEELVERYAVPDARQFTNAFCRECGSILPRGDQGQNPIGIPAGSLDGDPPARETIHIYTGSKAPWSELADALPQFETRPGK
jgi:hypothetical protein